MLCCPVFILVHSRSVFTFTPCPPHDASSHMTDLTHHTGPASQRTHSSVSVGSGGLWSVPHTPKHQAYFSHHCVHLLLGCFCTKFPRDHLVVCLDDWLLDGYKITFMLVVLFFSPAIMPHFHVFVCLQRRCVCAGAYEVINRHINHRQTVFFTCK